MKRDLIIILMKKIIADALNEEYEIIERKWNYIEERECGTPKETNKADIQCAVDEFTGNVSIGFNMPRYPENGCVEWNLVHNDEQICLYHAEASSEFISEDAIEVFGLKNLIDTINKIEEAAEEWRIEYLYDNTHIIQFEFFKTSPAGQDFSFCADLEDEDVSTLIDNIYEKYNDYDCSSEAYIWLDFSGHGINGAPYDMKEVYEDMESCQNMILELHDRLYKVFS